MGSTWTTLRRKQAEVLFQHHSPNHMPLHLPSQWPGNKRFWQKKKSNLGNAAVFKAVYSQGWKGRTGRCRQVLLKGAWSPIICFWVGPLETLHHGRLYVNQVKRAENSPLTLLITSLPLAKATPALPAGEVMGTV